MSEWTIAAIAVQAAAVLVPIGLWREFDVTRSEALTIALAITVVNLMMSVYKVREDVSSLRDDYAAATSGALTERIRTVKRLSSVEAPGQFLDDLDNDLQQQLRTRMLIPWIVLQADKTNALVIPPDQDALVYATMRHTFKCMNPGDEYLAIMELDELRNASSVSFLTDKALANDYNIRRIVLADKGRLGRLTDTQKGILREQEEIGVELRYVSHATGIVNPNFGVYGKVAVDAIDEMQCSVFRFDNTTILRRQDEWRVLWQSAAALSEL